MHPELKSATERGEAPAEGRCEVCGAKGPIVVLPEAAPPSRLCERCATEYSVSLGGDEEPAP